MLRTLLLLLAATLVAAPAYAQDDEFEDDDDSVDEEDTSDNQNIYEAFKKDISGEGPAEEIDAWYRYLDAYPGSMFRLEIEHRIDALEEAAFEELMRERADDDTDDGRTDAKRAEMDVLEPALIGMSANTRRRFEFGLLWGFADYINYDLTLEWAFARQFSVFGGVKHEGRAFGGTFQVGAKYALLKDVRTGIVLTGAVSIKLGYSSLDRLQFIVEPWVGFAWLPSDRFQLQTSLAMDVRLDRLRTWVVWDIMAVVRPTDVVGIYVESKQKHSLQGIDGLGTQYLAFYQAGAGVKIKPSPLIELTVGANAPYFWRLWKDYQYFGVHADVVFHFASKPKL